MGFALFVVYLVLTFVRPGEQTLSFAAWPVMDIASGLALIGGATAVAAGRGPTLRAVQIPLVLALCAWMLVSVAASSEPSGTALERVLGFGKSSGTAFLLVILNVDSVRRLRVVAILLAVVSLFVVGQASLAYHLGIRDTQFLMGASGPRESGAARGDLSPEASDRVTASEAAGEPIRIRGLGFFEDPNDLAITLIAILPLSLALRRKTTHWRNAVLVWIPAGAIVYGVYLTRSRGGVLALACVLGLSVRGRLGNALSALAGAGALMGLLALDFLGGRSMSIDQSAAGRIWAWSAGLQMLKSSPVWGVGFGMFTQYNEKVAHNSFVHCFAELGLVGYFLWLGLIMLTLDDMRSIIRQKAEGLIEVRRWAKAQTHSLIGFLVGGLFLSRSYDVMLFILLGLGAAIADLARRRGYRPRPRSLVRWSNSIIAAEIASIVVVWLYMRLLR